MTITFHLEANSMEELRIAACTALDLKIPGSPPGYVPMPIPEDQSQPDHVVGYQLNTAPVPEPEGVTHPAQVVETEKSKKPGKIKKLAPVKETPEEVITQVSEDGQGPGPDDHEEDPGQEDNNPGLTATSALPPKELLALKDKVIASLSKTFASGKRDEVRDFLATYGNGAKSFREIDVAEFPALAKKALEAGLAA